MATSSDSAATTSEAERPGVLTTGLATFRNSVASRDGGRRHVLLLGGMALLAFLGYAIVGLTRFHTYRTGIYDLVIFDQGIRGYANFNLALSHVKGNWSAFGEAASLLGDHFSPILLALVPLYWIHDGPETLIVAQAALLAGAAIPFWIYVRRMFNRRTAHLLALAYVLSWPVAETVYFHFHEYAFVPILTALLFERAQAGRKRQALLVACALLLVKEDMGLLVAATGAALVLRSGWRRPGLALAFGGVAYSVLAMYVLIPANGGTENRYWYYSAWGSDAVSAVKAIVTQPWRIFAVIVTPDTKAWTLLLVFLPLFLLPFLSPFVLLPAVMLAERMLATDPGASGWWGTSYHYNAAIIMATFCAAVDGAERLFRGRERPTLTGLERVWALGPVIAALAILPFFPLMNLFKPGFYEAGPRFAAATEAISRIPDGVLVESANALGPNISARVKVVTWAAKTAARPDRAAWILADVRERQPHFSSIEAQISDVNLLMRRGYDVVFARDGYMVLHRSA